MKTLIQYLIQYQIELQLISQFIAIFLFACLLSSINARKSKAKINLWSAAAEEDLRKRVQIRHDRIRDYIKQEVGIVGALPDSMIFDYLGEAERNVLRYEGREITPEEDIILCRHEASMWLCLVECHKRYHKAILENRVCVEEDNR